MRRIFVLILVIFATSVRPQEVLESSGEMPDISAVIPELVLGSGDGPVLIPEDDANVTSAVAFLSNSTDDGRAETTATTGVTSTTRSPTTTTVAATTTTTLAPTTTVTTTTTERATTTTTSRPTTTTTTTSTTEKPTTTTTRKPTTRTTTRRTTTAKTTVSTMSSTTEDFNVHAQQCFFVEEGFSCNVEVKCFGEGVIDCDAFEEEAQDTADEEESPSPSDDFSDDLESEAELTTVGLFPPELVGRVSPDRRPFLWHIDGLPTVALDVDATNATTVAPPTSTTTETTRSATTERMAETTRQTIVITISAETTTESRNVTTALPEILSLNETELESQASADNQTFLATNDTDGTAENGTTSTTVAPEAESVNSTIVVENTTTVDTTVSTTEEPTTTTVTTTTTTTPAPTTTTIRTTTRRRTGRRYRRNDGAVSAPLQAAALESSRQKKAPVRSCRLTGNLRCSPVPSLALCTGRSACTVPPTTPGEKSEKSTSAKGVETWAIAVIAICAVAAAFTISLLIYLVVTSWKKLKVQPQNGVTTLTYVNSAQP